MWKKDETPKQPPAEFDVGEKPAPSGEKRRGARSLVGSSLVIEGSVKGDEDLLVEGRVDGDITLPRNTVTVGGGGRVHATIEAKVIVVEGSVEGDLKGGEQIEIHRSGNVLGNIIAPRVGLEDGAQFKGNIDMSPKSKPGASGTAAAPSKATTGSASEGSSTGSPAGTSPTPASPTSQKSDEQSAGKAADSKLSG